MLQINIISNIMQIILDKICIYSNNSNSHTIISNNNSKIHMDNPILNNTIPMHCPNNNKFIVDNHSNNLVIIKIFLEAHNNTHHTNNLNKAINSMDNQINYLNITNNNTNQTISNNSIIIYHLKIPINKSDPPLLVKKNLQWQTHPISKCNQINNSNLVHNNNNNNPHHKIPMLSHNNNNRMFLNNK